MASHVYLLAHVSQARFKVGKANDILTRARSFGWEEIDFQQSLGLELSTEQAAHDLERQLLGAFAASRVPSEEVRMQGGRTDGATKWLRSDCRPRLERFLDQVQDLFPHRRRHGHELPKSYACVSCLPGRPSSAPCVSRKSWTRRWPSVKSANCASGVRKSNVNWGWCAWLHHCGLS